MKSIRVLFTVLALSVTVAGPSFAQSSQPSDEQLRTIALRIADLEMQRQLSSATPATIESLLALYADDVVYEHPNAGAVVRGKDAMRRGMTQHIGTIRAVAGDTPRVTTGHGVAIVESSARMEIEDGGKWVPVTRHGLRVIEFDAEGLVRRIIDYPW